MLTALIAKFRADPTNADHQALLGVALAATGNASALRDLFNAVHQAGGCGLECAFMVGHRLALHKHALLKQLVEGYDPQCPFRGALVAALGYAHALHYDLDGAVEAIRDGLRWVILVQNRIPGERLSSFSYTQLIKSAFLFERSDWSGAAAPLARVETLHQGCADSEFVCLAAADSRYFVTYAPGFLGDLRANAGVPADPVLVIVDPDAEALACAAELARRHPEATILVNAYGGPKLVEYCSGARFVLAADMLRRMGRPTIFLDIDTHFAPGYGEVLGHIAQFPLSSLHRHVAPPYLIAEASVVGAHPGEHSDAFFTEAAGYFMAKLAEEGPLWHIDQVALHRALCLARCRGFAPMDLGRMFQGGVELPGYFKKSHDLAFVNRFQGRTDAAAAEQSFAISAEGKPIFSSRSHTV